MSKFDRAIEILFSYEGILSIDSTDPGGITKYGISVQSYPGQDIALLTKEQAKDIYYRDWWLKYRYELLPEEIGVKIFILAVNMGAKMAHTILQRALRATKLSVIEDGILGVNTVTAVSQIAENILLAAIRSEAAGYYRVIIARTPKLIKFEKGWLTRAYD